MRWDEFGNKRKSCHLIAGNLSAGDTLLRDISALRKGNHLASMLLIIREAIKKHP